jgi:hypothetical protein
MIWLLVGVGVLLALWLFKPRMKSQQLYSNEFEFRQFVGDLKQRGSLLSSDERITMADETRRLSYAGYDRLFSGALAAGKTATFAHQAGVLDAAYCVFANTDAMRNSKNVQIILQCETVPFNAVTEPNGRAAITEYLVWKIFPEFADLSKVMPAIEGFVTKVREDAENDDDPEGTIDLLLRSGRYDWQDLAAVSLGKR